MFRRSLPSLTLALFVLIGAGDTFGVVRRDDQPDSLYRNFANRAAFSSVGRVEINYGNGYAPLGTATLYGRDRLVSAAHLFDDSTLSGAEGLRINFGNGRIRQIDFATAGVVNLNPGYDPRSLRIDVSVVFLSRPFNLAPARFYTGKKVKLDQAITFVGYGMTGTGLTGSRQYSFAKRAGENALGRYLYGGRDFEVDFDRSGTAIYNSLGSATALRREGLLGPGDSGGSAWVLKNKRWQLVGINSYGFDWFPRGSGNGIEDDYGDRSGFVYLPNYTKWIRSLPSPDFSPEQQLSSAVLSASAVPEPRAIILLAATAALLLVFRRRPRRG